MRQRLIYQRGYMQILAMASLVVFGTLLTLQAMDTVNKSREDSAKMAGVLAGQFKHALRALIADRGTAVTTGNFTGATWLKQSGTCAGASGTAAYLPCDFPEFLPLGLAYVTTVAVSDGTVTANVQLGAPSAGGEIWPHLAGIIVTAINGAANDYVTPVTQTYHVALHNLTTGDISMTVSNAPENLEFLKKDGTVLPSADFNWNNFSINNVRHLQATGNLTVGGTGTFASTVTAPDINATSTLNAHTVNVTNNLRLTQSQTPGGACATGSIGRTATGQILSCVSGLWQEAFGTGSTVINGYAAHGNTIPIPQGFSLSQCGITIANSTNYHGAEPNYYAGARASVDSSRRVTCGFYDNWNFYARGVCAYTVACNTTPPPVTTGPIAGESYTNNFQHTGGQYNSIPSGYTLAECNVTATNPFLSGVTPNASGWMLSCSGPPIFPGGPALCNYTITCVKS